MTSPSQRKGDRAEREIAAQLTDELGLSVRRKLGAGRADDCGDLEGIPNFTLQVADWADVLKAIRQKPVEVEQQKHNAGNPFAASLVRTRGGIWRVVQTVPQFCDVVRETLP